MPLYIDNLQFDEVSTDPANPENGQIWYNTLEHRLKIYSGGVVKVLAYVTDGPYSEETTSTTLTTTTSATYVPIPNMTLTPPAGIYMVFFTGSVWNTGINQTEYVSLFYGGVQIVSSERRVNHSSAGGTSPVASVARIAADGVSAIDVRWWTTGSTANNQNRSLAIIKVS